MSQDSEIPEAFQRTIRQAIGQEFMFIWELRMKKMEMKNKLPGHLCLIPGLKNIEADILDWFYKIPSKGNTPEVFNSIGDAYLTFIVQFNVYECRAGMKLFKKDIEEEVEKTGIISVRQIPTLSYDVESQTCRLCCRIVSYKGH